ncbi:MAG: ADP-forming succinate--CoA ligase subunit beta [Puniceicoccales bacterium]|jgi:succinyl-CoA synthetase beta subunit|nr:ADP-forming succinate--CoA ligase subunit beta [Puniceicoccales bacterium]
MKIHEFQTKQLMRSRGLPLCRGVAIGENDPVEETIGQLGSLNFYAVKAQIHSGGRGKGVFTNGVGSGVQLARSATAAAKIARGMLGNYLVTRQTGEGGQIVRRVYVEEGIAVKREIYLAILLDRSIGKLVAMASADGGVDIESAVEFGGKKIFREVIHSPSGIYPYQARRMAMAIGLQEDDLREKFVDLLGKLFTFYWESDASLVEINPLAQTSDGQLVILDGKSIHDDNGLFRQGTLRAMRDCDEEDEREVRASKYGLNYIALPGNIACLTNGAGLAMATMDLLHANGLEPANFLDLGDSTGEDTVTEAFKILCGDIRSRCLLINVFGGAMRGDVVAKGMLRAIDGNPYPFPIVVRMEGAYAAEGLEILKNSIPHSIAVKNMENIPRKIKNIFAKK